MRASAKEPKVPKWLVTRTAAAVIDGHATEPNFRQGRLKFIAES